ncbi:MAG: macro domain-containing protein [Planctomycetes bacterium]|nr:macro domain-containing protein [Planctomycetota bacterium]MCW8136161.1 macro domain-containing protein [Planctomycetota bacterium]
MNKEHIHLKLGTVKEAQADAIVSEINNDLIFAEEAHCSLGPDIDTEIIRQCLAIGKLDLGDAVVTDAGDLDARWVIHAASMNYDQVSTEDSIVNSLRAALKRASEIGARTVAVPPIGMATSHIPIKRVAELLLSEVLRHDTRESTVEEVSFYLPDKTMMRVFDECLKQV